MRKEQELVVFVDESASSEEVLALLRKMGVSFTTVKAAGTTVPTARFGTTSYIGVRDIGILASSLCNDAVSA